MATNYSSELKKTAKKSIIKSFLGTGAVGRAAMKTFAGKQEESDPVANALEEQSQVQDETSATIMRLEPVVVNIADNVYNIAGVWAERVASMEEAKRDQKERLSKEQAALEEAENEAARELAPLPSATDGADASKQQDTSERGLIGKLADSIKGMGGLLRGVMGRVGLLAKAIGAAGVAGVGGAALVAAMNDANEQGVSGTAPSTTPSGADQVTPPPPPTATGGTSGAVPSSSSQPGGITSATRSAAPAPGGTSGAVGGTSSAPGGTSGAVGGTASAPGGMSGAVSGTASAPGGLSGLMDNPDPLANGGLSPSPGSGEPAVEEPAGTGTSATAGVSSSAGGLSGAVGTLSSSPGGLSGAGGGGAGGTGGLSGGAGGTGDMSAGGLSPSVPASSGRDISSMSAMPSATYSEPAGPTVIQTNNQTVDDQTQDSPLPSPIADRGSLDIGVYFKARYA
jgi:hypothetical protein